MNDKVIALRSRKPLAETVAEEEKTIEEAKAESIAYHLDMIDRCRKLVEEGRLEGLVLVGRDTQTGLFLTDICFPNGAINAQEAIAYVGMLEMMKLEMSEVAAMAPVLLPDGSILDPYADESEDED